jgi:ABC-2 type transport system ATP-binding protein
MTTHVDFERLPGVELVGVERAFGPVRALAGIDLTIGAGEMVALLGPNGAGKSTLFDVILGLSAPDVGSATVFGRSPSGAVDAGLVAGMLQTGGLTRDVKVGELVAMVASLYPTTTAEVCFWSV